MHSIRASKTVSKYNCNCVLSYAVFLCVHIFDFGFRRCVLRRTIQLAIRVIINDLLTDLFTYLLTPLDVYRVNRLKPGLLKLLHFAIQV